MLCTGGLNGSSGMGTLLITVLFNQMTAFVKGVKNCYLYVYMHLRKT